MSVGTEGGYEDAIERAIHRTFSHDIYVVVRSIGEMDGLMAKYTFLNGIFRRALASQ